jgi:hypothetical protein
MFKGVFFAILVLAHSSALAQDTTHCVYKLRSGADTPDKIKEAIYYLIHTSKNVAAACAKATMLHTLEGPWIGSWSDGLGSVLQAKYEPNYPQSSEFPNHPLGNIRTGGEGFFHPYVYPKLPGPVPDTALRGSDNACGEEMIIAKEIVFTPPTLALDKGVKNAARHSSLACVLASFCGLTPAKGVMDTHEEMSLIDGDEDSRCDQWNNDHGLRAGRQLHEWLVSKKTAPACSAKLDGISDADMMPAFDLLAPPALKATAQGIFQADTQAQIDWVEKNCARAVEAMLRAGYLCIDRPKPLEASTYRKPTGTLPVPLHGACTQLAPPGATTEISSPDASDTR